MRDFCNLGLSDRGLRILLGVAMPPWAGSTPSLGSGACLRAFRLVPPGHRPRRLVPLLRPVRLAHPRAPLTPPHGGGARPSPHGLPPALRRLPAPPRGEWWARPRVTAWVGNRRSARMKTPTEREPKPRKKTLRARDVMTAEVVRVSVDLTVGDRRRLHGERDLGCPRGGRGGLAARGGLGFRHRAPALGGDRGYHRPGESRVLRPWLGGELQPRGVPQAPGPGGKPHGA